MTYEEKLAEYAKAKRVAAERRAAVASFEADYGKGPIYYFKA